MCALVSRGSLKILRDNSVCLGSERTRLLNRFGDGEVLAETPSSPSSPPCRRQTLRTLLSLPAAYISRPAFAEVGVNSRVFTDKDEGLFSLTLPNGYYALRRTVKGDLPDANGRGRRGATIFTAGDMKKASVVAVEKLPVKALLDEAGIDSSGDLSTFKKIGIDAGKVANLLNERRERERGQGQGRAKTLVVTDPAPVFASDSTLSFSLRTDIDVQKPDLLMEQEGVSELVRLTFAKAIVAKDGSLFIIYAGGLKQYMTGASDDEGRRLQEAVDTFRLL